MTLSEFFNTPTFEKFYYSLKFKIMFDLFNQGGPLFMGILTLLFFGIAILFVSTFSANSHHIRNSRRSLIKSLGLFALVFGVLGQLIGLFSAFASIEQMGSVSPNMLAGGLKVSMITTIYGVLIFLCSLVMLMIIQNKPTKLN